MTKEISDKSLLQKVIMYVLGGITTVISYVAILQREQVKTLEKINHDNKVYYQGVADNKDRQIAKIEREKDSLQGVILTRTDESFRELKSLMEIKSKNSTITIKPKRTR